MPYPESKKYFNPENVAEMEKSISSGIKYGYNDRGNKIKSIISCNGDTYQLEYDDNDNVIKEIDANGDVIRYEYDENNNKIKEIYPNGKVGKWEYDEKGN